MQLDLGQEREWEPRRQDRAVVLADARGWPPRAAAVVLADGAIHWTTYEVPENVVRFFSERKDNNIRGIRIDRDCISVVDVLGRASNASRRSVAVCLSRDLLANSIAESALKKRASRAFDHCMLVHSMWKCLAELRCSAWVGRVPTEENLSDLPSRQRSASVLSRPASRARERVRGEYELLKRVGGIERSPVLREEFAQPSAWRALSLRNWFA